MNDRNTAVHDTCGRENSARLKCPDLHWLLCDIFVAIDRLLANSISSSLIATLGLVVSCVFCSFLLPVQSSRLVQNGAARVGMQTSLAHFLPSVLPWQAISVSGPRRSVRERKATPFFKDFKELRVSCYRARRTFWSARACRLVRVQVRCD